MIKRIVLSGILLFGGLTASIAAPVNINTADAVTISSELNGIGETRAEAIIEYRNQNGPFASADDLLKVKGIGEKILEKIRDDVRISESE